MNKKWATRLLPLLLVLAMLLIPVAPVFAATSANVTVTATPAYIAITNAPGAWTVNDVADATGKTIVINTQYYANPLGDTTVPSDPVVDGECRFTVTNTSSVIIDLTVDFPHHTGGDASTNSDLGTNGASTFGAYSYFSGENYSTAKTIAKNTASVLAYEDLAATTDIKWGLAYLSQTGAWTSGTSMTSTVVITASAA